MARGDGQEDGDWQEGDGDGPYADAEEEEEEEVLRDYEDPMRRMIPTKMKRKKVGVKEVRRRKKSGEEKKRGEENRKRGTTRNTRKRTNTITKGTKRRWHSTTSERHQTQSTQAPRALLPQALFLERRRAPTGLRPVADTPT